MKKVLTVLCSMAVLLAFPANIFAEESNNNDVTSDGTENVVLYAEATSSYTVRLPKKVNVSATESEITIQAKGDIASDEEILITYDDSSCALADQSGAATTQDDVALTFAFDEGIDAFLFDGIKGDFAANSTVVINVTHDALPAGNWEATLPITIALTDLA